MIVVFGSINIDLVTPVACLPRAGESGPLLRVSTGRRGPPSSPRNGRAPTRSSSRPAPMPSSGTDALHRVRLGPDDILLLQREIPEEACLEAAETMKRAGGRVILNLAPAGAPAPALLEQLDILIVNEHEALVLAEAPRWQQRDPDAVAQRLDVERQIATVATLGEAGVVAWQGGKTSSARRAARCGGRWACRPGRRSRPQIIAASMAVWMAAARSWPGRYVSNNQTLR
ncbi:hypothetical protein FQV39_10115 [Bosea sp. F3-2]|uniref:PfkB family carbohydrate kinase n=1 Tax=Bosea sp. F3-2 TaxID=2599640 RepID=UPI0011EFE054|nr:PfkB family carbohydrate kinase [Bosea sp. F3-2]QEL22884.1 hypothetical protein FQV39_10115 [Bosea sp. F3-2]